MEFSVKRPFNLQNNFINLAHEARELYLPEQVTVLKHQPTATEFLRDYVSKNLPVIIESGNLQWEAFSKWKDQSYLADRLGSKNITVAVTPTGYADAPLDENKFVLPHETRMTFSHFLEILRHPSDQDGIFYIQKQNSNFLEEFQELVPDAASDIPWATEAFGKLPDAVNFWMGDGRSVTSMHKDHYENLYVVVQGSKTFTLHPPTDLPFIPYKMYSVVQYVRNDTGVFEVTSVVDNEGMDDKNVGENQNSETEDGQQVADLIKDIGTQDLYGTDENSNSNSNSTNAYVNQDNSCLQNDNAFDDNMRSQLVPWIAIDPLNPDLQKYPMYANAKPITCTLSAGQILYLPSLWFHHVIQSHGTIAVNFWYDMDYDIKYNYFKFVESLANSRAFQES